MKKILALITAVMLLVLVVLPGLGDSVVECTDKEGIAFVQGLFSSGNVTYEKLLYSSNARALFALGAGFCLTQEKVLDSDSNILTNAILSGNVYVGLQTEDSFTVLYIYTDNGVIVFTSDVLGLGICNYGKTDITSNISSDNYMESLKSAGFISRYWKVSVSDVLGFLGQ